MENIHEGLIEKRFCKKCKNPLEAKDHGNRKAHLVCAYKFKLQNQKDKYKIGNSAKLMIQKNETIAARLYKMDEQKCGIPHLVAMEQGLKFDCPSTIREHLNKEIHMLDQYGYSIETVNGKTLIFIYHEYDLH